MDQGNEQIGPKNRAFHCMTSIREFLIIYGGYENKTGTECNELLSYNTISGVWKRYQTPIEIKDRCVSSSICTVGNFVYIFGGKCSSFRNRLTNCLVSFDITSGIWETLFPHTDDYDQNTPPPMWGNLLCSHNSCLYVLKGIHELGKLDTLYKFCLKTSKWSLVQQNGPKPFFVVGIYGTFFKNQ
ncbi:Nitrile-specifier protein 5 [Thelohanellus kitauei]|uniref:Nitrile-specifier protein 5 n=1 Tax=Thelohanellus kitauei TaxID=669202 RepID=A0A0C2J048_THEKT|nr:Nitrile-specifier protein 5 [Thelohanellus kitauei]